MVDSTISTATAGADAKGKKSDVSDFFSNLAKGSGLNFSSPAAQAKIENLAAALDQLAKWIPGIAPLVNSFKGMLFDVAGIHHGSPGAPAGTPDLPGLTKFAKDIETSFKGVGENPTPEKLTEALQGMAKNTFSFKTPDAEKQYMDQIAATVQTANADGHLNADDIKGVSNQLMRAAGEAHLVAKNGETYEIQHRVQMAMVPINTAKLPDAASYKDTRITLDLNNPAQVKELFGNNSSIGAANAENGHLVTEENMLVTPEILQDRLGSKIGMQVVTQGEDKIGVRLFDASKGPEDKGVHIFMDALPAGIRQQLTEDLKPQASVATPAVAMSLTPN